MRKLLLLIAVACTVGAAADHTVIGRWRSLETSKGGIGGMFTFHEDGTLEFSPGAVVENKYRVEGNRLTLPSSTVNGPEQVWVIASATKTELNLGPEGGQSRAMSMTREGEIVDPKILFLGTWQSQGLASGMKSIWQFRADNILLLAMPFRIDKGRYSIKDDLIRIAVASGPAVEGKLRWDGDILVIPGPRGGGESRFARY